MNDIYEAVLTSSPCILRTSGDRECACERRYEEGGGGLAGDAPGQPTDHGCSCGTPWVATWCVMYIFDLVHELPLLLGNLILS